MQGNTTLSRRALGICLVALPALAWLTAAQAQKGLPSTLFDSEQPLQFRLEASYNDVRSLSVSVCLYVSLSTLSLSLCLSVCLSLSN